MVLRSRQLSIALIALTLCPTAMMGQKESAHDLYRHESVVRLVAPEGYLDPIWQSCTSLGGGEHVRVLHLGDSHVQAGYFTMPIREFFSLEFGLSGPGLIAPYAIARTNEPQHLRLRMTGGGRYSTDLITRRTYSSVSPTGIEARSTSSASQQLELSSKMDTRFDRVIVLHKPTDRAFAITGEFSQERASRPYSLHLSLSEADTLRLTQSRTSVTLVVPPSATFYGASLESSTAGVVVHTLGHNGATYGTYLKDHFIESTLALHPDLMIISLGTNDAMGRVDAASVRTSVRMMAHLIARYSPETKIILTTPLVCYISQRRHHSIPNRGVKVVAEAIKEEARELGVGYIDTYEIFGGESGASRMVSQGLLRSDKIHLTVEGYKALGNSVADALAKDYKRYLSSQLTTF